MPKQTDKELELFFKNARHEQKLTYEELAEKAEMSSRYLKEIENGGRVPSFHKIRKLVRALNVPPTVSFPTTKLSHWPKYLMFPANIFLV